MTIILYSSNSEPHRVDKLLTTIAELTGTLKNETSIINPTILIESYDYSMIPSCNYIYIPDFNRYYFINDMVSVKNGLWSISCHVDVLMTYKNQFRKLPAILARQENLYNLYLNDDRFLIDAQRIYQTKVFPNSVSPATSGGKSFILTLAGGAGD